MADQLTEPSSDDTHAQQQEEEELLRAHGVDPADPRLDQQIHRLRAGATTAQPYGAPGAPILRRSTFGTAVHASLGVLVVAVLAWALYLVRDVAMILIVALFLAVGLAPAVEFLRRHGVGALLAPALVMIGVLAMGVVTLLAGVPALVSQGDALREQIPRYLREGVERNGTLRELDASVGFVERVEEVAEDRPGAVALDAQAPERVLGLAVGVGRALFALVSIVVLMLYFLGNYRGLRHGAYRLVPQSRRARVALLSDEILDRIGRYVLGNVATSVVAGVTAAIVLALLDVPYPIALGVFVALTDVVPLVGATIGALVSSAMAFTVSAGAGIAAIVFFVVYQQFENFVLVPKVMRHAVDVSPATTIVAVLIGGALLGVAGALLAVPAAAALQLVVSEVVVPRQDAA